MSLRIIKGLPLDDYPEAQIGIMSHANTSTNFQDALREYPCDNLDFCDAIGAPCEYRDDFDACPARQRVLSQTIKMCDSGIFTREGATLTYDELYAVYERMGVEYGIMIDVFRDAEATIASAGEALAAYSPYEDTFNLVAVAQGETVADYISCYDTLNEMGFEYIAVGGLLQKVQGTARYTQVRDEAFMYEVLEEIRERHPDNWLLALGCLHPSRQERFARLNAWGDYKGWIFQYEKRNETLDSILDLLAENHLAHLDNLPDGRPVDLLQASIRERLASMETHAQLVQELTKGKRKLKEALHEVHEQLQTGYHEIATRFEKVKTHGLLKSNEEPVLREALQTLGIEGSEQAQLIWNTLENNRNIKAAVLSTEASIDEANERIAERLLELIQSTQDLPDDVAALGNEVVEVIRSTERAHRLAQVRNMMTDVFLRT